MPDIITGLIASTAISAGTSLIGGAVQAGAAGKAAKEQGKQADNALALQKQTYEANTKNLAPWMDAGKAALDEVRAGIADGSFDLSSYGYDDLIKDPGFQFRLDTGVKAMERSAAARGDLVSGDQMKGLLAYGQEMGSQEFGNAFARTAAERDARYNRLATLSANGQNAAAALTNAGANYAATAGNTMMAKGDAVAQGEINKGNAISGALTGVATSGNTGIENYMTLMRLKQPPGAPIVP